MKNYNELKAMVEEEVDYAQNVIKYISLNFYLPFKNYVQTVDTDIPAISIPLYYKYKYTFSVVNDIIACSLNQSTNIKLLITYNDGESILKDLQYTDEGFDYEHQEF